MICNCFGKFGFGLGWDGGLEPVEMLNALSLK
jgi:hypothetical protein